MSQFHSCAATASRPSIRVWDKRFLAAVFLATGTRDGRPLPLAYRYPFQLQFRNGLLVPNREA